MSSLSDRRSFCRTIKSLPKYDGTANNRLEKLKNRETEKRMLVEIKVSVIIATYRREETLKAALTSAIMQTYLKTEIILVDDNANVDWNEKVQAIVKQFPNVIYIKNEANQGSAESRNIGIRAASGEYVTFLDDDDIYLPEKIEQQVNHMIACRSDFSVTDLDLYNENGKLLEHRVRSYLDSLDRESLLKYHLTHHITGTDAIMFRREYLSSIGGFGPINIGDEFYLIKRAIEGNGKFSYLNRCDIKAYVHDDGGLSSGKGKILGENVLYKHKKQYFKKLDKRTRRQITMRHHAVLAYAYLRRKLWISFFIEAFLSFISMPIACISMAAKRLIK